MRIYQLFYKIFVNEENLETQFTPYASPRELSSDEVKKIKNIISPKARSFQSSKEELESSEISFFELDNRKNCILKASRDDKDQYFFHVLVWEEIWCSEAKDNCSSGNDSYNEIMPSLYEVPLHYLATLNEIQSFISKQPSSKGTEGFKRFLSFMSLFDYRIFDFNLKALLILYEIVNIGAEGLEYKDVILALDFAVKYGSTPLLENILDKLDEEKLNEVIFYSSEDSCRIPYLFLLKLAGYSLKPEYSDRAYDLFFNLMHFMLTDMNSFDVSTLLHMYSEVRNSEYVVIEKFIIKSAEYVRLNNVTNYLINAGKPDTAEFYVVSLLSDFICLEKKQRVQMFWDILKSNAEFEKYINACIGILVRSKHELKSVFAFFGDYSEYFANLVDISYDLCSSMEEYNNVIEAYSKALKGLEQDKVSQIIRSLMQKKHGGEISIFAFKYGMKNAEDRKGYFESYCKLVFDENEDYRNKCFSLALEELIIGFKSSDFNIDFYEKLIHYIEERRIERYIGKFLAIKLVDKFQEIIPIKIPLENEKYVIEKIDYIKDIYDITVRPDLPYIMHLAYVIDKNQITVDDFLQSGKKPDLEGISEEKYREILDLMFTVICPRLTDVSQHVKMMDVLMYNKFFITYFNIYINVMNKIFNASSQEFSEIKTRADSSYKLYLDFVFFMIKSKNLFSQKQFKDIEKFIIDNLERVDISLVKNFDKYMQQTIVKLVKSEDIREIRRDWQKIYRTLMEGIAKKSIMVKIQKIYKRQKPNNDQGKENVILIGKKRKSR